MFKEYSLRIGTTSDYFSRSESLEFVLGGAALAIGHRWFDCGRLQLRRLCSSGQRPRCAPFTFAKCAYDLIRFAAEILRQSCQRESNDVRMMKIFHAREVAKTQPHAV